jgi:competence protein ComEA
MIDFINEYKKYFIIGGIVSLIILVFISYIFLYEQEADVFVAPVVELLEEQFFVDVKGAVRNPGVYLFNEGDRVIDAIDIAGGLTRNGNTSNINLSQKLSSEMVVYVFTSNEIRNGAPGINCSTLCSANIIEVNNCFGEVQSNKVNINTAGIEQLITLPGIGEARARTIIDYRNENGLFERIEDLQRVSGIGTATFESLKELITV